MKQLFEVVGEYVNTKMKPKRVKRFNRLAAMLVPVLVLLLVFCVPVMASEASGVVTSTASPSNGTPSVGDTITVTINIDMTGAPGVALGSFDCTLDWNPAVLTYVNNSEVQGGFTGAVNAGNAGSGRFIFNGAKYTGATGDIVVMTITFNVVGAGTTALDLDYSAMAAASTFVDLLPNLTINDGSVTAVQSYTITWKNDDGTTLETDTGVPYGATPTYNGPTPTKAPTAQYTYTFAGWDPEVADVTGDITYTAIYTATTNAYTITWKNDDGTTLETDGDVPYGATPSYDGDTPTKAPTAQFTYTFAGWDPEVAAVTGDITYTATYTATTNAYTITFNSNGGSAVDPITQDYGTTIDTAPVSTKTWYTPEGWYADEELTSKVTFPYTITGDATFYAKWTINGLLGDVNGDGKVNSTDALIVLTYAAELEVPPFPENIGDVDIDGEVNSDDALIILSYAAGLEVPFPVGEAM